MSEAAQDDYDDWAADGEGSESIEGPKTDTPEPADDTSSAKPEASGEQHKESTEEASKEAEADDVDQLRRERDELKGRYADLEHRWKSDEGRVQSMRKQIADLEKQLEETRAELPQTSAGPESEDWKEFQELYPEAAKALSQQMQRKEPESTAPPWDAVMDAARPGWRETVWDEAGNTRPEFASWLNQQPPEWQRLANTPDAFASITVYDRYQQHRADKRRQADKVQADRLQRLQSSESVGGTRSKPPPDNDPLSGWAAD